MAKRSTAKPEGKAQTQVAPPAGAPNARPGYIIVNGVEYEDNSPEGIAARGGNMNGEDGNDGAAHSDPVQEKFDNTASELPATEDVEVEYSDTSAPGSPPSELPRETDESITTKFRDPNEVLTDPVTATDTDAGASQDQARATKNEEWAKKVANAPAAPEGHYWKEGDNGDMIATPFDTPSDAQQADAVEVEPVELSAQERHMRRGIELSNRVAGFLLMDAQTVLASEPFDILEQVLARYDTLADEKLTVDKQLSEANDEIAKAKLAAEQMATMLNAKGEEIKALHMKIETLEGGNKDSMGFKRVLPA